MSRLGPGVSARIVRSWGAICGLITVFAFAGPHVATAQTYLPSIKIGTAALISPVSANTYYGSGTSSTDGLSGLTHIETPTPPEIVELARALKNDPDLIYQYVHNNIQTVWMYGLQKGALGAEIDKSGTPFDQAELMVALLRQAGKTVSYVAGTVQFNQAQFNAWTAITNARAACQLLANGGIPATVNGVNNVACSTIDSAAQVSTVEMAHIWVKVTMSGCSPSAFCVFDPSYKTYNWKTGIPLATAMALTPGQTLTHAMSGSTTGTDSVGGGAPVSYVQSVKAGNLNTDLQNYASNLLSYIQSHNLQGAQIEDIVGGGVIVPDNTALRQATLPYADQSPPYVFHTWTPGSDPARYNAVPDQYRTVLTVEAQTQQYNNPCCDTHTVEMFNPTPLFVDEIYGRRLSIETNFTAAGIGIQHDYYVQNTCLALDVQPWNTWPANQCLLTYTYDYSPTSLLDARALPATVILTAKHPYSASADGTATTHGDYMKATVTKPVKLLTSLAIVHGWGDTSAALFSKWSGERAADSVLPVLNTAPKCPGGEGGEGDLCPSFYLQPTGGYTREKTAGAWLAQFSRAAKLNAAMANAVPQIHHTLGVVYGEAGTTGVLVNPTQLSGMIVADNFDRIDVDAGISVTAKTSSTAATNARRGAIMTMAASSAALEGSISGQLQDVVDTSSTATRFEWGNAPDPDHSPTGQNPFGVTAQKFYQYDLSNYTEAAGPPGFKTQGLSRVDGDITGSCNGSSPVTWGTPPTLTVGACYGTAAVGINPAVEGITNRLGDWVGSYALAGFTVVASAEAYLGPGQRGGKINPSYGSNGFPTTYTFDLGKQRGGAFVALKVDANGDPTEIAHIIIGGKAITKGGGGGTQPDDKTTYDPATAAEVLKSRFVDRSKLLGVDLANGSLGTTSPVSIGIGNGGFPYELSAGSSWHAGPGPEGFSATSPIAPQAGWTNSWLNSMSFSGSGMEAMGQSDIRGAIGAIVSFYAAQDIYQATETPGREVAGVLTQSWWAHQLSGNVATVNVGGNARQFVRIATGDWIEPGAGYATGKQIGTRVPYEDKCYHATLGQPPYALSRGWNSSGVAFEVTNAQGDLEHFSYFMNPYYLDDVHQCGELKGFRLTSWTFPQNVSIAPTYAPITVGDDQLDALSTISNSVGRSLAFAPTTITAGARHISVSDASPQPLSMTDAMGRTTSYTYVPPQAMSATMRPVPYALLASVTTPENTAQHNTEYDYDALGRINQVLDAVAIQQGTRGPYQFYLADGTRGERDDPLGQPYSVVYDTYGHASRYIDELGFETDALFDSRGRALSYTYPEGDCEAFAYDDHNNTTDFWKVDEASACNIGAGATHVLHASATWDPGWNKPLTVTNARGFTTTLTYYPAVGSPVGSVSLLNTATRPTITEGTPFYQFDYDTAGKLADMTGPTGIVTHNDYDGSQNLLDTIVDPGTGSHLHLTTSFGYDSDGDVTLTTDPRTIVSTSLYDLDRRKTEDDHHDGNALAALNAASKTLYDAIGRVTDNQVGTAFSGTTVTTWLTTKHTTYTPTSKVATVTDADNRTTTTAYDDGDRTLTVTDPVSRATHFTYCGAGEANCAANQVEKEIRAWSTGNACAVSGTLQECYRRVTYFPDGEEQTVKDANGNTTIYGYDGWNRLNSTAFPDGTAETIPLTGGYDANGNVTKRITRAGQELDYTYNALDWMSQKVSLSSSLTTSWTYLLDGRVDVINDTAGFKIDYGYDTAGRMNQVANRIDGFGADRTVNYTLDANGNRTQLQWPAQDAAYAVGYCYDTLNRMTQAMENSTTCGSGTLATYSYDTQSRRTSVTYGNGASVTYTSYSDAGDLKTLNENFTGTSNNNIFSYTYTPAHQTNMIAASNAAFFWQPPANTSTSYTVNNLNQYPTIGTQTTGGTDCFGHAQGLSYDCNGNVTFDGNFTYTYDAENRLLKASSASVNAKYEYDPLGRRTKKSGTGVTTTFFLSNGTDEIAEYNSSNTVTTRYIPGPSIDEPIAVEAVSTGAKEYFLSDRQGSVVAMSDGTGALAEGPYTYDAWGNCFVGLTVCSVTGEPYRFTGRRYDAETGCYYYRARYYCPDDKRGGRFLQTDSVGYTADLNLYTYVGNDPIDKTDPSGNFAPLLPVLAAACVESGTCEWLGFEAAAMLGIEFYSHAGPQLHPWNFSSRAIDNGLILYRLYGGEGADAAKMLGRSWTPMDPHLMSNPRDWLGIPAQNDMSKEVIGELMRADQVLLRQAQATTGPAGTTTGGGPEVFVTTPGDSQTVVPNVIKPLVTGPFTGKRTQPRFGGAETPTGHAPDFAKHGCPLQPGLTCSPF